ncbi:hypothetical protein [Nakamurella antarctica]|uniref:hypothetical protein n=1 Tax=Nakamurella antarctica TaxID=1902245 RepID=UPI0019D13CC0|nr:hypothetical protein [Nakamurella antarctica]
MALSVLAVTGMLIGSIASEAAAALAMILVQGFDAAIGRMISDRVKTFGPAITALANAGALVWMLTSWPA